MDEMQLSTLRQMREYLDQIDELESEIFELTERKSKESEVSKDGFKTDHEETLNHEKRKKIAKIPSHTVLAVLALIAGLVIGVKFFTFLVALILAAVGFSVIKIPASIIGKKKRQAIEDEYAPLIDEAVEKDKKEKQRYEAAVKAKKAECDRLYDPQIDQKKEEIGRIKKEYDKIKIISDKDLDEDSDIIDTFIEWMESSYADNVKECFKLKREQEAEAARIAAENARLEEERRRNSPGTVIVSASRKESNYSYIPIRNSVYIDDVEVGYALREGSSFTLNPGSHAIHVIVQPNSDTLYKSQTLTFYLEGGSTANFKCIMLGYGNIYFTEMSCHPGIDKSGNSCKLY